jgi:hypothetical protein
MVHGNEYAWEDIQIILPGKTVPVEGIISIDYETKKDHTEIYGRGDKPVALGRGKKEFSGNMSLLQSEVEAMQMLLGVGKDLTNISAFQVTVAYAPEGGIATVDMLLFVRIKSFKKGMKTGDGNMTVDCELAIGDIKYNI